MSLAPRWGAGTDGANALWRNELPRGGSGDSAGGFKGELGYGFGLAGGRFTGTPNVGFGASDNARDYRVGWRLTPAVPGYAGFRVDLDATRRESGQRRRAARPRRDAHRRDPVVGGVFISPPPWSIPCGK